MIYKNVYSKYKMSEQKDEDIPMSEQNDDIRLDNPIEEEEQEQKEPSKNEVLLKLGDVIIIYDPTNEILNENVFLIEYIDPRKIKLINGDTFEKVTLNISPSGVIGDGSIKAIKIISSNPNLGYARQNDLLPGTWINIYFGGEIPTVITGQITNLEEDMIEIKTTDDDTLFINFNYQGIPEDLPIETFEIRPALKEQEQKQELSPDKLVDIGEDFVREEDEDLEDGEIYEDPDIRATEKDIITKKGVKEKLQTIFDMSDIQFGDIINVEEYINIDKDKYRFNIDAQTNDMLEEMISGIPNYKRTNKVLNNIHNIITRFIQLRKISSTFDLNKNITGIIKHTADDRPLAEYLAEFKNTLFWIMMVAKNVKKIYSNPKSKNALGNFGDYEMIDDNQDILELSNLFKSYKSNKSVEGQNKYSNLYHSVDPYMTPFYSVNPDKAEDVYSKPNGIIIEGNVETNINAIVDNLGDLYSTIVSNSEIKNRKFVIQKYNLGLDKLYANTFKGQHFMAHRFKLTDNDQISINSVITLPEPTVRFSQVNLPGTSLLVKANLNLQFLNYWELLKQKTTLTPVVVDGLDNEIEYDDNNFVDNIKQYFLDLTEYNRTEELTNLDIYKIFLRTIIPKIRILFNLVKKYIKGRLSLVDVVNYLEPFLIYPIDLTFMQYKEINNFIYDKIREYNRRFDEYGKAFSSLRYQAKVKGQQWGYKFSNPLFNMFQDNLNLNTTVFQSYEFTQPSTISGSEFLRKITLADYGNLYNTATALTNIKLMFPDRLTDVFETDKNRMKTILEKDMKNNTCSTFIISKKYYSIDALTADNNKNIYYDKEYDTTNYDLLEQKYKSQRDKLQEDELILFLTEEFKTKNKMDEQSAEYMAATLVNQAKKVREGDYALLVTDIDENQMPNIMEYYVRKDDVWVLDDKVDPEAFIKDNDLLCNINYECIYNAVEKTEDKCETIDVSKDKIISNALKQIIDQFDKNYEISKDELNSKINIELLYFQKIFDKIQSLNSKNFLKYNDQKYNLGLSVSQEQQQKIVSPYSKLRNLILGQNDFIKRQNDIVRFVSLYCREGDPSIPNLNDGEMENEWWLYCVKTNTKLLPKFHYILANTFITNNSKYDDVLNELKRQIGQRSDDGDAWVDEHSGEVICLIDMDVGEGYKDGFVDKSRDIIEKDAGEVIMEQQKDKRDARDKPAKRLSPEGEIISNVITILSSNMGIDIEPLRNYIIKIVTELMADTKVIEKEGAYKKREEEAAKKGKKLQSYGLVYSSTILYLTLGMYLIAIQTSIPSIKTRKTAPGCIRSFDGFPFSGEGDDSAVKYVACVALKSRDPSTIPWNALQKNEEKIVTIIKSFIVKFLLPYGSVTQKIIDKTDYLLTNPEQYVPDEHNVDKWFNFLPPLKRFNVRNLQNVSGSFIDSLHSDLEQGNTNQLEKILVIQSKIIAYSLAIQETIQKLVEKKDLLLRSAGQPFMDNACCNEAGKATLTTLQYFNDEDNSISIYNTIVKELSAVISDINKLTESAIMLSDVNTKRPFPEIDNGFSEETIYHAFISFCKFQSSIPLDEELATICVDKPDYLNKMDTIQEKITKLKRDGREYTKEQFLRLFQLVSRHNIIKMSINLPNVSCISGLKNVLKMLDDTNNEYIPKALTGHLDALVDNYDLMLEDDNEIMKNTKNYLQRLIDNMRKNLILFIRTKGDFRKANDFKKLSAFITNISNWKYDKQQRNTDTKITDDALYNYVNFFKNFIELFAVTFPSMLLNKSIQTIDPPKYWELSKNHENDVREMVSDFYNPINSFYGNSVVTNVLREILEKSRGIYLLSQTTPSLTSIKQNGREMYGVFDKRTTTLLYEYYFLSVLTDYIDLTNDSSMIRKMLSNPDKKSDDIFSTDFLIDQELKFTEDEQQFIEGDAMMLRKNVANLLIGYLNIMMDSKNTVNVSYDDVEDKVFKLKEAEKYTFTDKLRDMTDEERAVDNILKNNKLGPLYSLGLSKGIKEYDKEHFEHDKQVAEKVAEIQNKLRRQQRDVDDMDDAIDEERNEQDIDMDLALDRNITDDYDDGDPWGEELDNEYEYD
jgi:tRNA-binding EMAP/Myf-like protein